MAMTTDEKTDVVYAERRRVIAAIDELASELGEDEGASQALAAVRYFILTGIHLQGYGPKGGV